MIKLPKKLRKIEDEEWRELLESNGRYWVSNYGRVKSFAYNKKEGNIMKQTIVNDFPMVKMVLNKKKTSFYTHKLVAKIWLEMPNGAADHVIHKDWNKKNNHYTNLEYASSEVVRARTAERLKEVYANPRRPKKITQSKLKPQHVLMMKRLIKNNIPNNVISKMFLVSDMQVTRIKRGENWGHIQLIENE